MNRLYLMKGGDLTTRTIGTLKQVYLGMKRITLVFCWDPEIGFRFV